MGVPKLKTKINAQEYLEGEQASPVRHEFVSGEVYAMARASDRHHRIAANVFTFLDSHLR
ncbi:MAG: Uma2 family endonuclease [Blastocatellia bacterium]